MIIPGDVVVGIEVVVAGIEVVVAGVEVVVAGMEVVGIVTVESIKEVTLMKHCG